METSDRREATTAARALFLCFHRPSLFPFVAKVPLRSSLVKRQPTRRQCHCSRTLDQSVLSQYLFTVLLHVFALFCLFPKCNLALPPPRSSFTRRAAHASGGRASRATWDSLGVGSLQRSITPSEFV